MRMYGKCAACRQLMIVTFKGQTMHPTCHGDHPPSAACGECEAERRAHRRAGGQATTPDLH